MKEIIRTLVGLAIIIIPILTIDFWGTIMLNEFGLFGSLFFSAPIATVILCVFTYLTEMKLTTNNK